MGRFQANPGSRPGADTLVPALNTMNNVKWSRRTSFDNHVPQAVINLLLLVAVCGLGFVAYGNGLNGARQHGVTALYAVLIGLVLLISIDLDRPRTGLIQVDENGLLRLQAAMARHTH